jgi:hypothetical protein
MKLRKRRQIPSVCGERFVKSRRKSQLLTNRLRDHEFDDDEVATVEDHIAASAARMTLAVDGKKWNDLSASDFPVTSYPDSCEGCPFRKPCWEASA